MAKNIVREEDVEKLVEGGRLTPVEQPPALPSNFNALTNPYPAGSLPLTMQYAPDLLNTQTRGGAVPTIRLMPIAPAGQVSVNSANQNAVEPVKKIANTAQTTANTANSTANTANATATTAATGVTTINSQTAVALVAGQFEQVPISTLNNTSLTPTLDNLLDGSVFGRVVNTALTSNKIDTTKSGVLANYGSLPNTVVSNSASVFAYTSTSTSANITWSSFDLFFSDGTTVTISSGSQAVSGLTAGTYFFYPFVAAGATTVSFVSGGSGSNGTPANLYAPQSAMASQTQNGQANCPLSVGSVTIVVTTGGSGSGGGSGRCCAHFTKVEHREKGIVPISECKIGDFIWARSGWTEIKQFKLVPQKTFVRFTTQDGASATVTSTHCITAIRDGEEKSVAAARVALTDFLISRDGYAAIKKIEMVQMEDGRKAVLSCSPDSVFFGGDESPALALHNLVPIS